MLRGCSLTDAEARSRQERPFPGVVFSTNSVGLHVGGAAGAVTLHQAWSTDPNLLVAPAAAPGLLKTSAPSSVLSLDYATWEAPGRTRKPAPCVVVVEGG